MGAFPDSISRTSFSTPSKCNNAHWPWIILQHTARGFMGMEMEISIPSASNEKLYESFKFP